MKKILTMALAIMMFAGFASAQEKQVIDLIAGQNTIAGSVELWNDTNFMYVKYLTNEDWSLQETHLAIAEELSEIPQTKKGNPKIGNFEYKMSYDPAVEEYTYKISLQDIPETFYGAAHAVVTDLSSCVYSNDLEAFANSLPEQTILKVWYPYPGAPSYLRSAMIEGISQSQVNGWCADLDKDIDQGVEYISNVYSTYETLPEGLISYEENLDLVNYLINHDNVGDESIGCQGNYTYGDVQYAMWTLLDDNIENLNISDAGLGSYSQCRIDELVNDAYINGEGFMPECGELIGVIIAPVNGSQPVIFGIPLTCQAYECSTETAWASGERFVEKGSWATYFIHE